MAAMLKIAEVEMEHSDDDEQRRRQRTGIPPPISERKLRRYSSCEKLLVGDSLNVAKNDKIARMMMRNGKERLMLWIAQQFVSYIQPAFAYRC